MNIVRTRVSKKKSDLVFAYWLPVLTGILFFALFGIAVFNLIYRTKTIGNEIISHDVRQLVQIFKKIDHDCNIAGFDYQKNNIDYLNVGSFEGSEIGSLDLKYPSNWKGPYVKDNPTIQNKAYQVVQTRFGHFIVPGDGVKLSDGKIIGKDIVLNEKADVERMTAKGGPLNQGGASLAAKLEIGDNLFSSNVDKSIAVSVQGVRWF